MKTLSALLLIVSISFAAAAQTVPLTFAWDPSTSTNVTGYRLYSSTNDNLPIAQWTLVASVGNVTNVTINAQRATLYYRATSTFTNVVNSTNYVFEESEFSNPVKTTVIGGGNLKVSK